MQGSENLANGESDNFLEKHSGNIFNPLRWLNIFKIFGALIIRISSIQTCQVVVYVHLFNRKSHKYLELGLGPRHKKPYSPMLSSSQLA